MQHKTSRTRVFIPSNPARPSLPGWARHCARALHTLTAPGPHALRPGIVACCPCCCHVAAMLLLRYCIRSFSFPPPSGLCSFDKPPTPPPPPPPPPPSQAPTSRRIRNPRAVNQDTIRNRLPFLGCLLCGILSRSKVIRPSVLASCKLQVGASVFYCWDSRRSRRSRRSLAGAATCDVIEVASCQ
jgi:hypothetical protein